jgi:hypothetical protein
MKPMRAKSFSTAAGLLTALLGVVPAFGFPLQVVPFPSTDTVINAFTQGEQSSPSVAARGADGFVAVWEDKGDLPGGVKMRFLDAAGKPQGGEVSIDKSGTSFVRPRVSSAADGSFAVAWATNQDAWVQRFDTLGQPRGAKLLINSGQPLDSSLPLDVAMAPDGSFVVIYGQPFFSGDIILARRFDAAGHAAGNAVDLDAGTPMEARINARVTAGAAGCLLAVWQERAGFYLMANRYDAPSGAWSGVFQVSGDFFNVVAPPAPLLYPDGTGVVVWNKYGENLVAQRLDARGLLKGSLITVGEGNLIAVEPALAADAAGNTYIVWSADASQSLDGIVVDPAWVPRGPALIVGGLFDGFSASQPALAIGGGRRAEVLWTSGPIIGDLPVVPPVPIVNGEDGSYLGIVGQVFNTPLCDWGSDTLCLGPSGRFQAHVAWRNPSSGETGTGSTLPLTTDTGAFWFFDYRNLELMVKVLDGTSINDHFWVYGGSLSDVEYTLTVEDFLTGMTRSYHNPAGQFSSLADVEAFPPGVSADRTDRTARTTGTIGTKTGAFLGCPPVTADPTSLCLASGHFAVSVQFTDPRTGLAEAATAASVTDDTGAFWFFDNSNLELMIKVLDGRAINGKFWVFYGALSDVDYTITVTRPDTGEVRTYHNPRGTLASHADTQAF